MPITSGQIPVTPGSGKTLDTAELTVSSTTVEREVIVIASPSIAGNYTEVTANSSLQTDLTTVAGNSVVTAATGVQQVGISGNTGVAMDAADNSSAATNALQASGYYSTTIPAITSGNAALLRVDSTGALYVNSEGRKATYRASVTNLTPVASSTEPYFTIQGSSTKTVRITRLIVSMIDSTGSTTTASLILFRYSAMSGGTASSTPTPFLNDTNNASATAVVKSWSTLNTSVTANGGPASSIIYGNITHSATVVPPLPYEWMFGMQGGSQEIVLRGTSDWLGLCISAVGTTPLINIAVEWTEE